MEGIEDKLGQLLNDPNSMAQIMSMVQSLGLGAPPEEKEDTAPPPNDEMLRSVLQIMQQTQQDSPKEEALLKALKPFLRQDRQKQMDKAAGANGAPCRLCHSQLWTDRRFGRCIIAIRQIPAVATSGRVFPLPRHRGRRNRHAIRSRPLRQNHRVHPNHRVRRSRRAIRSHCVQPSAFRSRF